MAKQRKNKSLPNGWAVATVGAISLKIHYGYTATTSDENTGVKYLRITDISESGVDWEKVPFCKIEQSDIENYALKESDIVFARTGGTVGKSFLIKNDVPQNAVFASYLIRIIGSKNVNSKYLSYFFQSNDYWHRIEINKTGLKTNVNAQILSNIEFNLAPTNEQNRIVSKIEELLGELENGKEQLNIALQQLKIYRQALLRFAFEGKLTQNWRKRQNKLADVQTLLRNIESEREKKENVSGGKPRKIESLSKEEILLLPKIPKGWIWCRNEELMDYTTSGSRDWKKYYNKTGPLFIRTQDIKTNSLNLDNIARVKLPKNVEGKRSLVEVNDILMTITGANVGKVARIEQKIPEAYVSQSVALMKFIDKRISPYMYYYFQARGFGETFIEKMVYGVGRQVLSLENMKEVPVCICSLTEQNRIVQELESRFRICDTLEKTILSNINRSESLRQSILQRAFEGSLVKQNPNDEPAEILLDKIKQERQLFLEKEKIHKRDKPKKVKSNYMEKQIKPILQLLQKSKKPISTYALWKSSEFSEDIDGFYAKLKKHIDKGEIKELPRKGQESFLTASTSK